MARSLLTRLPAAACLLAGFFLFASPAQAQQGIRSSSALQTLSWQLDSFGATPQARDESVAESSAQPAQGRPTDRWLLIEHGGAAMTLLDAKRMIRLRTQAPEKTLTGDIAISADGRAAYLSDESGGIGRYALPELRLERRVHTDARIAAFALSGDGRWLLAATREPYSLWLFDQNLQTVRSYPLTSLDGKSSGYVASIQPNLTRSSFIVTLRAINELWEISWNRQAEPIFDGLVHDYRMGEGLASSGFLGVRRTLLEAGLPQVVLSPNGLLAIGSNPAQPAASASTEVIHLDIRRRIATLPLTGAVPALAFRQDGRDHLAGIDAGGQLVVLDLRTWETERTLAPDQPVTMLNHTRSTAGGGHIWLVMCTPKADTCGLSAVDFSGTFHLHPIGNQLAPPIHFGARTGGQRLMVAGSGQNATLFAYDAATLQAAGQLAVTSLKGLQSVPAQSPSTQGQ